jgi:hypothetical protein
MNGQLEPAIAAFLIVVLAGILLAGSGAVLRLVALCRHHIDRLGRLENAETRLREMRARQEELQKKAQERMAPKGSRK